MSTVDMPKLNEIVSGGCHVYNSNVGFIIVGSTGILDENDFDMNLIQRYSEICLQMAISFVHLPQFLAVY